MDNQFTSIHKQIHIRNSNIELLRILSMIMILGLHVNVYSLGVPTQQETIQYPLSSFARCAFEMLCIISVNLFVLISGWFGIRFNYIGLGKYVFHCLFIISLMYIIGLLTGVTSMSLYEILQCGAFVGNAWFVTAYLGLYIIAPILNIFCEKSDEKQFRYLLITFYLFQTIYGNIFQKTAFIVGGYSTFSFIGLYLLAFYMRHYGQRFVKYAKKIYCFSTIGLIILYYLPIRLGIPYINTIPFVYTCPLNISASLGLILWVTSMKPRFNKIINFIAASVFTVYLSHICNDWTALMYRDVSQEIYANYSGLLYLCIISLFIFLVFACAIFLDQIRKILWNIIYRTINFWISKETSHPLIKPSTY